MNRKIIFFDADGTIVSRNGISKLTLEAFEKLRENGHILVLSTGRPLCAIDGTLGEVKFENIICSAGGTVVVNNEVVYNNPMSKENQKELLDYFDKNNAVYNMESKDYIYIKKGQKEKYMKLFELPKREEVSDEDYKKFLNMRECISKRTKEIEDPSKININKIHYYGADILYDGNECPLDFDEIINDLGDKYKIVSLSLSKKFCGGEICEKGISKKTGMSVVLDYFNVNSEDIYAIGDDYNDIEMLEFATTSIAMGQSPEEVKSYANYITKDIDSDGFYYAMKHFNLI